MTTLNPYGEYILDKAPLTIPKEDVAIFRPLINSEGKKDVTGAFAPEALNFCHRYRIDSSRITIIDNKLPRLELADSLLFWMEKQQSMGPPIPIWAFFCHGFTHGIQFGIRDSKHPLAGVEDNYNFAKFIGILAAHPSPIVILYACSTGDDPDGDPDTAPGSGDNSFGDILRDELCKRGCTYCRIFTHTTSGPACANPNIKMLDGEGSLSGGVGGEFVVSPGTPEYRKLRDLLHRDFRFEIPFLTLEAARSKLK